MDGLDLRKSVTVIPTWDATLAHVSPCLAVMLRLQAAMTCWEKLRAKSKKLLVKSVATIITMGQGHKLVRGVQDYSSKNTWWTTMISGRDCFII